MSKKVKSTSIGIFVVGAVALVIVGVIVFGSGKFFKERTPIVMFFEGSIKGLNIGAPVTIQGVEAGSVTDIVLEYNPSDMTTQVPVYAELDPEKIKKVGKDPTLIRGANALIKRGLKAQLEVQSFITGQLMVALDFYPDKPVRLVGGYREVPEIPTIPTTMQELSKTLEEINLKEVAEEIARIVDAVEETLEAAEIAESMRSIRNILNDVQKLVKNVEKQVDPLVTSIKGAFDDTQKLALNIDGQIEPLATSMKDTLDDTQRLVRNVDGQIEPLATSIKDTLDDTQKLARNVNAQVDPVATSVTDTLKSAGDALEQAKETLSVVDGVISEESALYYELTNTLEQLSATARSLRIMADYLERHPESLIQGKGIINTLGAGRFHSGSFRRFV